MDRPNPASQSSGFISWPAGVIQTMSGSGSPSPRLTGRPSKNRRRRKVGCCRRSRATDAVNSISGSSASSQWIQLSSESWQ